MNKKSNPIKFQRIKDAEAAKSPDINMGALILSIILTATLTSCITTLITLNIVASLAIKKVTFLPAPAHSDETSETAEDAEGTEATENTETSEVVEGAEITEDPTATTEEN